MAQGKLKLIEMTIFLTKQVYVGFTCKNLKSELGSITLNKNILSTSSANLKSDLKSMTDKEGTKNRKGPEKCLGIVKALSLAAWSTYQNVWFHFKQQLFRNMHIAHTTPPGNTSQILPYFVSGSLIF